MLFICALVVSFAALMLRARAANDTMQAQINNIPSKSHVIPLLQINQKFFSTFSNEPDCSITWQADEVAKRVQHMRVFKI